MNLKAILIFVLSIGLQSLIAQNTASVEYYNSTRSVSKKKIVEKVDYSLWNKLLQKHVSVTGKVNYNGFKTDVAALKTFLYKLSNTTIDASWDKEDKIAYWINVYNAYTIKLIIDHYPITSIKEIKNPWKEEFFKIDEKPMSLNDVEHKILRKFGEPRIHFAINCASASCPPLLNKAFTCSNLNNLLEKQAYTFINTSFYNNITKDSYELSKIFDWFKGDFKLNNKSLIDFINLYSKNPISSQKNNGFKKYNWELNSK